MRIKVRGQGRGRGQGWGSKSGTRLGSRSGGSRERVMVGGLGVGVRGQSGLVGVEV